MCSISNHMIHLFSSVKTISTKYILFIFILSLVQLIKGSSESTHLTLRIKKFNYFNFNRQVINNEDLKKNLNYFNYYIQKSYHQNIIYYNNLILALVILVILFSILVILEENDTFYNLSAIAFLLLITFNLIILIFSHNLAKQFLIDQNFFRV